VKLRGGCSDISLIISNFLLLKYWMYLWKLLLLFNYESLGYLMAQCHLQDCIVLNEMRG
jgi:hypothetical protein